MTSAELHRYSRPLLVLALSGFGLVNEPLSVLYALHGVGFLETRYGTAWRRTGVGSNNWAADQAGRPPCDLSQSFEYVDTHPNADGTSTPYRICFRRYASAELGAKGLVKIEYLRRPTVLAAARAGDFYGVSAELHRTRYYEGFGKTVAARIANHYKALSSAVRGAALALEEPEPVLQPVPVPEPWQDDVLEDNPLILRGSFGPYVKVWQRIVNQRLEDLALPALAVDGAFGRLTRKETMAWQKAYGLKDDGKVGPRTWGRAADLAEAA